MDKEAGRERQSEEKIVDMEAGREKQSEEKTVDKEAGRERKGEEAKQTSPSTPRASKR